MQRLRQEQKKHSYDIKQLNHSLRVKLKNDTNYIVSITNKHDAIADENNQ